MNDRQINYLKLQFALGLNGLFGTIASILLTVVVVAILTAIIYITTHWFIFTMLMPAE